MTIPQNDDIKIDIIAELERLAKLFAQHEREVELETTNSALDEMSAETQLPIDSIAAN